MADAALLERPTYGFPEVDDLLRLSPGTAKRWVDGYERQGRWYDPVVRLESTRHEVVMQRGRVLVQGGTFHGAPGQGQFLLRSRIAV
jgi:hypothetical protein